jgi:hypothetical protein
MLHLIGCYTRPTPARVAPPGRETIAGLRLLVEIKKIAVSQFIQDGSGRFFLRRKSGLKSLDW